MPVHTVETIVRLFLNLPIAEADYRIPQLISVISLLSSDTPNTDSPANVDAAKEVRTDLAGMFLYTSEITTTHRQI